ncbi:MAG: hypothetical protein ABS41_02325 [Arenimonas sp. SCN 70-307]|uniref:hypothetical protein n=1 Tax=Arenimonas sp. SCN 70-307 TaxID=1660089 RepID=UPI00086A6B94|nr:hypothetical protein [Arenimonas sp. SCN 70-307]ODS64548.1 MAG: hypothetical protein ABS41_02325 [Arenimonas sp. SCN 70-307]
MTAGLGWLAAFPHAEAQRAVSAVHASWTTLASRDRPHFGPGVPEPKLTRVLKQHAERVTARQLGLLGYWGAEGVDNDVDFESGEITDETRTDILYAWNDEARSLRLVFEFKRVGHLAESRKKYYGTNGLMRFVTGRYSHGQAVAVMSAILISDPADGLASLRRSLKQPATAALLRMVANPEGHWLHEPSALFPAECAFDTEHLRPGELGPAHRTIRVAHLFLQFGYPVPTRKGRGRDATLRALESD